MKPGDYMLLWSWSIFISVIAVFAFGESLVVKPTMLQIWVVWLMAFVIPSFVYVRGMLGYFNVKDGDGK